MASDVKHSGVPVLALSPTSTGEADFGAVIGYRMLLPEAGIAVLELEIGPHHRNRLGTVHGGVLMAMLDAAGMWACRSDDERADSPTVSITCSFLKAVKPEASSTLVARGELVRRGARMCFANVTASVGAEVVATAQAVFAVPPSGGQAGVQGR